ncbi:TATA-box-binding protein [Natronorubrum tibetense]|uniref:TATA-box-binding protein n=1 Tax=Natronorubrum tibetense GA33 TaxID=1114856 RepID=L9VF18_9EURY|nr:TATA-box-binding protein [Natronorubrum tibetense]ELY35537.1 transcription factor [Natronorubrum tibetense GA33]
MTNAVDTIEIQNVVASTGVGQELELDALGQDLDDVQYDPDHFPGLIYRLQDPKATVLLFRTGKIVCTGATSVHNVQTALQDVFDTLRSLGIEAPADREITVQNIVSNADLDRQLNLNAIAIGLGLENVEYEPEQFPGLLYRLDEPEAVVLLFTSGKLLITGVKTREAIEDSLAVIIDRLEQLGLLD